MRHDVRTGFEEMSVKSEASAEIEELLERAENELLGSKQAWKQGNAGKGRVCARRAAGMALRAWLLQEPNATYGSNFMHHLGALADDESHEISIRESAWRLAARGMPESGFIEPMPDPLVPATDARSIMDWCCQRMKK